MRSRRVLVPFSRVVLLILLGACFTACKNRTSPSPPSAASTEILFWHGMDAPHLQEYLEASIATFHTLHPDIHVALVQYPGHMDEASRRLQLKIALDERPDLVWLPPVYTGELAASGVLRPVADFIQRDTSFHPEDFAPWLWDVSSYGGTRYTLPYQANVLAMLYNKTSFREAGIARPPQTWSEFAEAARTLTRDRDGDQRIDQYGFLVPMGTREWTVWTWQTFLWQAGGRFLTESNRAPAFHHPPGVEALQFWVDLVHTWQAATLSAPEMGWDITPFLQERVAMQISGPWELPQLDTASVDYGVFSLPERQQRATNIGGENLFIVHTTPEREQAAWTLAKHLARPEAQRKRLIQTGQFPVRTSVYTSDWFQRYLDTHPSFSAFYQQLEYGRTRPSTSEYFSLSEALGRAIEQALNKETSARAALEAAAQQVAMTLRQPRTP